MKFQRSVLGAALALVFLGAGAGHGQTPPPLSPQSISQLDVGEQDEISLARERQLGDKIAKELYQDPDYIDDPLIDEMVNDLWHTLLAASLETRHMSPAMHQAFAWQIFLGKDRTINAFALPGGYLGLHLGLIGMTTQPEELASVLAHELSHVTQRHISRGNAQQSKLAPAIMAAMVLGAIAAKKSDAVAQAAVVGSQAVGLQLQLNYSRDMEREADRVGYAVLKQARYPTQGFVTMFEKLQNANRLTDNNQFPYLRTHPLNTERIGEMQARQLQAAPVPLADQSNAGVMAPLVTTGLPQVASNPGAPSALAYTLLAARAKSLSTIDPEVLRQSALESQGTAFAQVSRERQASTLVMASRYHLQVRQYDQAQQLLDRLARLEPRDQQVKRLVQWMQAEVAAAQGDWKAVSQRISPIPGRRPEQLLGAQAAIGLGQPERAVDPLQVWVIDHPQDANAWHLLARAYEAQNQPIRSVRALAEAQVAQGDLTGAIDRLKAVQSLYQGKSLLPAQEIDLSIVNARFNTLSQQLALQSNKK